MCLQISKVYRFQKRAVHRGAPSKPTERSCLRTGGNEEEAGACITTPPNQVNVLEICDGVSWSVDYGLY